MTKFDYDKPHLPKTLGYLTLKNCTKNLWEKLVCPMKILFEICFAEFKSCQGIEFLDFDH